MKKFKILTLGIMSIYMIFINMGCEEAKKTAAALKISKIEASGNDVLTGKPVTIDLFGASAATSVPIDVTITVTFDKDIDATTITSTNFSVNGVEGTVSGGNTVVKLSLKSILTKGTSYTFAISSNVRAKDGGAFTAGSITFTTGGVKPVVLPTTQLAAQKAYWAFDGNTKENSNLFTTSAEVDVTYGTDRHNQTNSAIAFNGKTSIVEIAKADTLLNTTNFTLSFWVKADSVGKSGSGHFVMGIGAFNGFAYEINGGYAESKFAFQYRTKSTDPTYDAKQVSEDMWFPSLAKYNNDVTAWKGWTYALSLTADQMKAKLLNNWYHCVYTYDGATKIGSLYFDGVLQKTFDFNLWGNTDTKYYVERLKFNSASTEVTNHLAFGFNQSRAGTLWATESWGGYKFPGANHFKGLLDDVRFIHLTLSATEVKALYDSEK